MKNGGGGWKPRQCQNPKGFLLLEVIIAFVIMTAALSVMIHSLVQVARAAAFCQDYTQANFLVDNAMFQAILNPPDARAGLKPEPGMFEGYGAELEFAPGSENKDNLDEVRLQVTWPRSQTSQKSGMSVSTLLLKPADKDAS